jgi:hypothetical protein
MGRRSRGVSIAETLVAIFLLALLITVVFNLFPTTILANRQGSERLRALNVAQSVLANKRTVAFSDLVVGSSEQLEQREVGGHSYQPTVRILAPSQGDPGNLKVLQVSVAWESKSQKHRLTEEIWIHRVMED